MRSPKIAASIDSPVDKTDIDVLDDTSVSSSLNESLLGPWRKRAEDPSLAEAFSSVKVSENASPWKKMMAFSGLGFIVCVGYMDPGNWATDLEGGSRFGYSLLFVVFLSSFAGMFIQYLSLKLGIATERDLAQCCRDAFHPYVNILLWIVMEVAIAATDLAEVLGSAIAINLLSQGTIPLYAGVLITASNVLLVLLLSKSFRVLELLIFLLVLVIIGCFTYELAIAKPDMIMVFKGLVPSADLVTNSAMLYIGIGILGATVMPHNIFLHSSIIQTRAYKRTTTGKKMAIRYGSIDSVVSLAIALYINASILILSAAAFKYGHNPEQDGAQQEITDIRDAYKILSPTLGDRAASTLFAIALLASGQNSTITGTLSGQIVMEGFLRIKMRPWMRRTTTRLMAVVPAVVVAGFMGGDGVAKLLVLSQVILSLSLSFAVLPLVYFTSHRGYMGAAFVNKIYTMVIGWLIGLFIAGLNLYLLVFGIQRNVLWEG